MSSQRSGINAPKSLRRTRYDRRVLGDAPLIGFLAVTDLGRAREFYVDRLGLTVTDETPFALVVNAGGTMLRLTLVSDLEPQIFTVAGWRVREIDISVDDLVARGVNFVQFDGMNQDDRGIWTSPNGDRVAWFRDPDGNTLSLTSM